MQMHLHLVKGVPWPGDEFLDRDPRSTYSTLYETLVACPECVCFNYANIYLKRGTSRAQR